MTLMLIGNQAMAKIFTIQCHSQPSKESQLYNKFLWLNRTTYFYTLIGIQIGQITMKNNLVLFVKVEVACIWNLSNSKTYKHLKQKKTKIIVYVHRNTHECFFSNIFIITRNIKRKKKQSYVQEKNNRKTVWLYCNERLVTTVKIN